MNDLELMELLKSSNIDLKDYFIDKLEIMTKLQKERLEYELLKKNIN